MPVIHSFMAISLLPNALIGIWQEIILLPQLWFKVARGLPLLPPLSIYFVVPPFLWKAQSGQRGLSWDC